MRAYSKVVFLFAFFMACVSYAQTGRSFVTLQQATNAPGIPNKGAFLRKDADGVLATSAFRVPTGKILIITDIDCDVGAVSGGSPQPNLKLFLTSPTVISPGTNDIVDSKVLVALLGPTSSSEKTQLSRTFVSGIPISSKVKLWWQASGPVTNVRVKGYFVSDP